MAASMVASLTACGGSNNNSTDATNATASSNTTVNQEITADQYADTIKGNAETYKTYISLPEYKGLSVTVDSEQAQVSENDVTDYIDNLISQYGTTETVTEGVTASGDVISLDYSGLLDGTAFSGGTATDVTYTIGSGKFIDDLDKGLVGLTVGQEYDIPCKFPDDYSSSDLAGKDVIFKVTVNSIKKTTLPELTDEWVASNASSLNVEATTVDGLKSYVKDYLETQAKTNYDSSKYQAAWKVISDGITNNNGYPEDELNSLIDTLKSNIQSEYNQYGSYYGISDYATYLSQVYGFESEDAFNDYAKEYAQSYLLEKMAITIIAENENITVTADDINDMGAQLASYYGYTDYQEILDSYGNQMNSEVGYDSMMSSYTGGLEQNCGMVVFDADGKVICSSDTFENNNTRYRLNSKKLLSLIDGAEWDNDTCGNTEGYSVVKKESSVTGWTVYVYEPRKLVLRSANSMITMIVVAFVVAVAGAAAASIFTTGFITRRINKLKNSMAKVENGDFDAVINTQDKDEIGDLIHSFNSMTTQIKNLITQVYEGRISQKESEMRALRAQINPHFLYNSLSLINWKAIEYEQEDISEITLALSNYYRTSLNKGKNILSFEQELSNMQSYLKIQQIMHDNSFDVVINVSEEVMPCESLNLILQPLVENAIDHGIDLLTDRKGIITVEAKMQTDEEGKKLVCVTVSDNGVGMDKETAQNFLTVQSKGYGARNVNDRIRLYYGESYHLEVQSIPDEGTTITIKFPAKPYNTKN